MRHLKDYYSKRIITSNLLPGAVPHHPSCTADGRGHPGHQLSDFPHRSCSTPALPRLKPHLLSDHFCFAEIISVSREVPPSPSPSPQPICHHSSLPLIPSSPPSGVPLPSPTYIFSSLCNLNPKRGIPERRLPGTYPPPPSPHLRLSPSNIRDLLPL